MLTQEKLKSFLHYNEDTGTFTRAKTSSSSIKGSVAGYTNTSGYIVIGVSGKQYLAHRLVFLYVYGYLPENEVDHINCCKSDNRLSNLRHVTAHCNTQNCKTRVTNRSGFIGVSWHKQRSKWSAEIKLLGKKCFLGLYEDKIEAALARFTAEIWSKDYTCNSIQELTKQIQRACPSLKLSHLA